MRKISGSLVHFTNVSIVMLQNRAKNIMESHFYGYARNQKKFQNLEK